MNAPVAGIPAQAGWWRRNRFWLLGAIVLGAIAFVWPYQEALRHYQRNHPLHPIQVPAGEWARYEGARWRVVDAQLHSGVGPGTRFKVREDAAVVVVRFEVILDRDTRAKRIDACQGRLSDAAGREWEANPIALSRYRSALPRNCASSMDKRTFDRVNAKPGEPFRFEHVYLVPKTATLRGAHPEIRLPQPKTPGTYLRFSL